MAVARWPLVMWRRWIAAGASRDAGCGSGRGRTITKIECVIVDPVDPKLAGEGRTLIDGKPIDAE